MLLFFRSCIFYLGYSVSLLFFGLLSFPLLFFPTTIAAPIVILWNRFVIFWLRVCCNIRYNIRGDLNTIAAPCVVIANHQSPLETIFLQLHCYPLTTVLKKELLNIPFFGWGLRLLKPIAIDRGNPIQALKQIKNIGVERLQQGQNVLIFPEGTRQPVDKLGSFARSGVDMAKLANVPVVMIAHDSGKYWKNKQFLKHPGTVSVTISELIDVSDKHSKQAMQEIAEWIEKQLK